MTNRLKIAENDLPKSFTVKLLGRRVTQGLWGIKNTRRPVDEMVNIAKGSNLSLPIVKLQISPLGIHVTHFPAVLSEIAKKSGSIDEKPQKKLTVLKNLKKFHNFVSHKTQKRNEAENRNASLSMTVDDKITDFSQLQKMKEDFKFKHDASFFGIDTISYGVQDLVYTRVFSIIVVSDHEDTTRFHCYAFICEDRYTARTLTYSLAAAFQVFSRTMKSKFPAITITPVRNMKPKILSIDLRSPEEKKFGKKLEFSEA